MERWVLYATLSMLFAGFTSVIAKMGMEGISAELGLSVRTLFVCGFVFMFALMFVDPAELPRLNGRSLMWLCIPAPPRRFHGSSTTRPSRKVRWPPWR